MQNVIEAELRLALAEGLLSREEAERLGEEARRLDRAPLELLRERGRLSDGTFLSLRAAARGAHQDAPDPRPSSPELPAFPVVDWERYQGVRFLGQGGMGRVFLARDPRLRRDVALKFVREDNAEMTRRILSEARAQARVNHERVCKVYEVGEIQGRVYIAMQYIDGQPLHLLARELTVEQKAMVLRDAAEGVHEAHRAGLIHRDLKPSNIMVERTREGVLKPYVMDFGLARDWKQELTATGTVLGTPHYMAPEQARGEVTTLDRRADVYSLGATLYSVLTGRPPIPGDNALEVLNNIASWEPRSPRALVPLLPVDLEAITLKCLEKDRSARYDSARALAEELERFLSGEPVQARSSGIWYRLRKRWRRHRLLFSTAAVAFLAVVLSLGWAGLQRREVLTRERLARRFTEQVERIEATARYSALSRQHDIRADRKVLQASMEQLEKEIREAGAPAVGPGRYALGRGMLALGDEAKAREHLEAAWASGFREPRVAWELALVMGRLYQRQVLEAERVRDAGQRQTRKRDIAQRFREPALTYLHQSQGAPVDSPHYVNALLAFYEERLDEALDQLEAMGGAAPWFYEAPKLRGDILTARATQHWNAGKREQALADFEAGRRAYLQAAATAESDPELSRALGELEYSALLMGLYGQGEVQAPFTRGSEAVARALALMPEDADTLVLKARFHRRLAEDLVNHGHDAQAVLKTAVDSAQAALALVPTRPQARMELGNISLQWAQYQQERGLDSREQLARALECFAGIRPEDQDYVFHMQLGLARDYQAEDARQHGRDARAALDAAIDAYRAALQLDERSSLAWANLGSAYFTRATLPQPQDPQGDLDRALSALDKSRTLNPQYVIACFYAAQAHRERARWISRHGGDALPELEQTLALHEQGITLNPSLPQLHNGAGAVLIDQAQELWDRGEDPLGPLARALSAHERALALAPEQGFGYNNIGRVHAKWARYLLSLGQDPRARVRLAVDAYEEALKQIPGLAQPWSNLGEVWNVQAAYELESGRDPEPALARASEALRRALDRNPQLADAWLQVAKTRGLQACWHARRGQARLEEFTQAAEAFQKALDIAPTSQRYPLEFGRFRREWSAWQEQTGREFRTVLQQGLESMEAVLTARPGWAEARAVRAGLRMRLAETRESAREELRQALVLNPHLQHERGDLL